MRRFASLWGVSMVAALLALTLGSSSLAQEATPTPHSPDPEECTLEPRTVEELQELHGTPAPEGAGEATSIVQATPEEFTWPRGEPADPETEAEIVEAVHQLTACHNAGHYLAGFGGVTDEFIISQVGHSLFDEDFVAAMSATPVPLAEEHQTIVIDVEEVRVLEDGRVGALYHYHGPTPQPEGIEGIESDLFIFENVDGQWLLDESIQNVEGTHGPEGIATPGS